MRNYCRYCGHCIENGYNEYYCTLKDKFLTTETVKHWACGSYGDCGIDVFTGEDRKERKSFIRTKKVDDAEPVRHGHWIRDGHHIRCSECSEYICDKDREGNTIPQNYCPNCGAKMKGE